MFVQLEHAKTKRLQSYLDEIGTVFEVYLFDIAHQSGSSNTRSIHQQMLLNCESLAIENSLDLDALAIEKLDNTLVNLDHLEKRNFFAKHNWFFSLFHAVFEPPYGTNLAHSDRSAFFQSLLQLWLLTEKDCEIYDWAGHPGSGREDCSEWNDYFEPGRDWWGNWCLTIYSAKQNKGCVLLASSTD